MRRLAFAVTLSLCSAILCSSATSFAQEAELGLPVASPRAAAVIDDDELQDLLPGDPPPIVPTQADQVQADQAQADDAPAESTLQAPSLESPAPAPLPGPKLDLPQPTVVRERPFTQLKPPVDVLPPHDSAYQPHYPRLHGPSFPAPPSRKTEAQEAIHRKAELKAAQRQRRLATQKWFGYSNSRPSASATPFMGIYSPTWSGNSNSPYLWNGSTYWPSSIREDLSIRR